METLFVAACLFLSMLSISLVLQYHAISISDAAVLLPNSTSISGIRAELAHVDSLLDMGTRQRLTMSIHQSLGRFRFLARRVAAKSGNRTARVSSFADGGFYIMTLALGTPPQKFTAVMDTGSDLVWRQSSPCFDCFNQISPFFNPNKSSTFAMLPCKHKLCASDVRRMGCAADKTCEYYYNYGDGSTSIGGLASDVITIGKFSAKRFVFGAGVENYGHIAGTRVDGVVGMGGGPLSLPSQMAKTIGGKFSYCLVTWTDAPSKTSPLLFGSAADMHGPDVKSTPFVSVHWEGAETYYYLKLKGMSVGGKPLRIPKGTFDLQHDGSGGVMIDCGSTVSVLMPGAYQPLKHAYASRIRLPRVDGSSVGLDLCFNSTNVKQVEIPALTFHFEGADLDMPPDNTFFDQDGQLCLAFLSGDISDTPLTIIGNAQQQNFQILFDKGNKNQLSFKPTRCDAL